jgi:hypothetical protein
MPCASLAKRLKITAAVLLCAGICPPLRANITPVTRGHAQGGTVLPTATTDVRVLSERLTVDITPIENRHVTPRVSVAAEYVLRHDGALPIELDLAFPLAGAFEDVYAIHGDRTPVEGLGYDVTLDGAAVASRDEPLPMPQTARSATPWGRGWRGPDQAEQERLTAALRRWVDADAHLAAALAEYARIAPSWEQSDRATKALEAEIEPLLTRKWLAHYVVNYLRDPGSDSTIHELIAEADPTKRKSSGTNYVSSVPSWPHPDKQALDGYRKTIDAWLATRPAITARYADLARQYETQRAARAFMAEKVAKQLENKPGLSKLAIARLLQYFENAYNPNPRGYTEKGWAPPAKTLPSYAPDEWLVAQLDPDVERERLRRIAEADALLERYGFDSSFISPLTGRSYAQRVGWRDDSTWTTLAFTAPPTMDEQSALGRHSFERNSYRTIVDSPRSEAKLIRFAVPLHPAQSRTLRVAYRALAEVDDIAMGGGYAYQIVHVRYILKTARNWKSFGPIELTVTMPSGGLAVMEPAPTEQPSVSEGRVTYKATIDNVATNLRIAWLPATKDGRSQLFALPERSDLPDLRALQKSVTHSQAQRVLTAMIALADQPQPSPQSPRSALGGIDNLMKAGFTRDEAIAIGAVDDSSGMRKRALEDAAETLRYVRHLAKFGFERNDLFNEPILTMSKEDRRIAATWIGQVPGEPTNPEARLARAYAAMLAASTPTAAQSFEFMEAARADDQTKRLALNLIARFPCDPRCCAPLVMEVLAKPPPKTTVPDPMPWYLYVAALSAFANGAAAPLDDVLRILDKADGAQLVNSFRIGELYGSEMGFECMREICDRIVRSGHAPDHWVRSLYKLDPARTRQAVDAWAKDGLDASTVKRIREQILKEP